jgi:hypothetical protein
MLFYTLWDDGGGFQSYDAGLEYLRAYRLVCSEIRQLVTLGVAASKHAAKGLGTGLQHIPLLSHATYRREEILAALQYASLESGRNARHREGVAWCKASSTDVLFVTIDKDDKKHSPSTMYEDYALSQDQFHWKSQNTTSLASPTGTRYLNRTGQESRVILFVRNTAEDELGLTVPYLCLGKVEYASHEGENPISISWRLKRSMPADAYLRAAAVVS